MNFDIAAIEAAADATFDVVVGTRDTGEPVGFKVRGTGSDAYAKAQRAIEVRAVKESAARKQPLNLATDEGANRAVVGGEEAKRLILEACIVDWFGFSIDGKPAKFTPENLQRVLRAKPEWGARLLREIQNDANFMTG